MRISDWSSDVCSSDLDRREGQAGPLPGDRKMDVPEEQMTDVAVLAEHVEEGIRFGERHAVEVSHADRQRRVVHEDVDRPVEGFGEALFDPGDRKSTRLNSSH